MKNIFCLIISILFLQISIVSAQNQEMTVSGTLLHSSDTTIAALIDGNIHFDVFLFKVDGSQVTGTITDINYSFDNEFFITITEDVSVFNEINSFAVRPSLDTNQALGVTTLDLVRITQQILGLNMYTDAAQFLASDVSGNSRLSVLDLVELRRIILGIDTTFQNQDSYQFVRQELFNSLTWNGNSLLYPTPPIDERSFIQGTYTYSNYDMIIIKTGDVTGAFMN